MVAEERSITKMNSLIDAVYEFTLAEYRILNLIFTKINPTGQLDQKKHSIDFFEYMDAYNVSKTRAVKDFNSARFSLVERSIQIFNVEKNEDEVIGLLEKTSTSSEIVRGESIKPSGLNAMHIVFTDSIMKYLTEIQACFTTYKFKHIKMFRSVSHIRLYEYLCKIGGMRSETILIDDLKERINYPKGRCVRPSNFINSFLKPAIDHIQDVSNLEVCMMINKSGRKFDSISFGVVKISDAKVA